MKLSQLATQLETQPAIGNHLTGQPAHHVRRSSVSQITSWISVRLPSSSRAMKLSQLATQLDIELGTQLAPCHETLLAR